jgi:hypothetical protein
MFVALKPLGERVDHCEDVIARLRKQTSAVVGARVFFQAMQDID